MTSDLRTEIKQSRPFGSIEQEAMLNIARTSAVLEHAFAETLKPHGLTPTQYNVLRILRGAEPDGLCRYEVRERMIAKVPDVTRLLDRMEQMGWIARQRETADRRMVRTQITRAGLELLDDLEPGVTRFHQAQLGHLGPERLRTLIQLLSKARGGS